MLEQNRQQVEVEYEGDWYKAAILEQKDGQYKVHYDGWDDSFDEWVGPARLRGLAGRTFPVGSKVQVLWQEEWYPATILKLEGDRHYVHYDGESDEWDQWVTPERIRG